MSDLNYPDNLYADHLAKQEPTGAYRAPAETDTVEAALRAACIALSNAMDRLRTAQSAYLRERDQPTGCNAPIQPVLQTDASTQHGQARKLYDAQTARDVAWSAKRGDYLPPNLAVAINTPEDVAVMRSAMTWDELRSIGIGDVEPRHVLHAEALRQADEFERGDKETGV